MAAEARRLKSEGVDVFDFALGEPDFPTPGEHPGGRHPGHEGRAYTHYTPPAGIPELKQALAEHYSHQDGPAHPGQPRSSSRTGPSTRSTTP